MKLYIIKAWNSSGGGIGTYYVVASGVNAAKKAVKESEPIAKRVQCIEERQVIITK
jgi:microcompartment protein CcmK/EutM